MPDTDLAALLDSLGYRGPAAQAAARQVLVRAGLTTGRKPRIDTGKVAAVAQALETALAPVCGAPICAADAERQRPGAAPLEAAAEACVACNGSENRRAAMRLSSAAHGRRPRLLVVGGSPETRRQVEALAAGFAQLRFVDGLGRSTEDHAKTQTAWAEVVLIWGSTQLDHKVSNHYSRAAKAITVPKRGVAALLDAAAVRLDRTR